MDYIGPSCKPVLVYKDHLYSKKDLYKHGRGNWWACFGRNCSATIAVVDGKITEDSPPEHNHEAERKQVVVQKITANFFAVIQQKRAANPFCEINLQKEYKKFQSEVDIEDAEFIPDSKDMKHLLKDYVKKRYPDIVERIRKNAEQLKVHILIIKGAPI